MKTLYPYHRRQAGRFAGITHAALALLLLLGLVQIALCFKAAVGLVPPADRIFSATLTSAYVTNTPMAHTVSTPKNEKS
jgi:hypothetical protein